MKKRMDEVVKFLRRSKYAKQVLKALGAYVTSPERLASKLSLSVRTVESALKRLAEKGLVKPSGGTKKRSLYEATSLGKAALRMKNQWGFLKWKGTNKQKRIARRATGKK